LVDLEIKATIEMQALAAFDSRLGFHSEAEGYKYFPEKLRWRLGRLKKLLKTEFPLLERKITRKELLFPNYSGAQKTGPTHEGRQTESQSGSIKWSGIPEARFEGPAEGWETSWKATRNNRGLTFRIECFQKTAAFRSRQKDFDQNDRIALSIEPRRLWPSRDFHIAQFGQQIEDGKIVPAAENWRASVRQGAKSWTALVDIPFPALGGCAGDQWRVNLSRIIPGFGSSSWAPLHPLPCRGIFGLSNSADLGWLLFKKDYGFE
jgi:hypothetical protein